MGQLAGLPLRGGRGSSSGTPVRYTCGAGRPRTRGSGALRGTREVTPRPERGSAPPLCPKPREEAALVRLGSPPHPLVCCVAASPLPPGRASGKCQRDRKLPSGKRWQQTGDEQQPRLTQPGLCREGALWPLQGPARPGGSLQSRLPLQGRGRCAEVLLRAQYPASSRGG